MLELLQDMVLQVLDQLVKAFLGHTTAVLQMLSILALIPIATTPLELETQVMDLPLPQLGLQLGLELELLTITALKETLAQPAKVLRDHITAVLPML
jgi:hypothetical protein